MSSPDSSKPAESLAKSFGDRLTFPKDATKSAADSSATKQKFDWADEVAEPASGPAETPATPAQSAPMQKKDEGEKAGDGLGDAQLDGGGGAMLNGSDGLAEPEFNVNIKLSDLQNDPNNPLHSVKSFDELNLREELVRGLAQMNFHKPSKIQEWALPLLMHNPPKNLIGQSQSGTGKTAAFTLNMLSRVDLSNPQPQALVLAPTRELARQIAGVAKLMGLFLIDKGLVVSEAVPNPATRGQPIVGQVIVGTPGTTMDMIKRKQLDVTHIRVLTIDEADNMLDKQGMGDQCERVKRLLPRNVQYVLFSATFAERELSFAERFAPDANTLTLEAEKLTVKGIKQMYLDCASDEEKYTALVKFYGLMTIASSIIFVRRRDTASEIERRMTAEGHRVASLTGALDGSERDEVFNRFRSGEAKVLITTNVLARGIDVQTVTLVINYDIPTLADGRTPDFETYLHRIGRTGRFGRTGAALSFVHNRSSWEQLMEICHHFQVEPTKLDTSDWDALEKLLKTIMKNKRNKIPSESAMEG